MTSRFQNRVEAGRLLARRLGRYAGRADVLVLALPRGGVPVGYEVARALGVPLDVLIVRKLGALDQPELAMGAIASGGVQVLNGGVIKALGINELEIEAVARREARELERRERAYRGDRPAPEVQDKCVILVDDGIATGSTTYAAISALRQLGVRRVIVAVPVVARSTFEEMRPEADELVALSTPDDFGAVGLWYEDFNPTTDVEVCSLLAKAAEPAMSGKA